jgi:hypothetical protein
MADTERQTLNSFIRKHGVTIRCQRVDGNPYMSQSQDMDHWNCTLQLGRKRMTVPFSMGYGHNGRAPTAADVLNSLALDSSTADQSFEGWCNEYGYDTDSRSAEKTYRVCVRQREKLLRFLGENAFSTLVYETEGL